jgi:hypothetical protein
MDWFDQDDNMFLENDRASFSNENDLDIENVFMKRQNSFTDYEIKMDEFVLNKFEGKPDSKFLLDGIEKLGKNSEDKMVNQKLNKIFNINKESRKFSKNSEKCSKNKALTKEELARHPFLNSNFSASGVSVGVSSVKETCAGTVSPSSKPESVHQSSTVNNMTSRDFYPSTASVGDQSESVINSLKNETLVTTNSKKENSEEESRDEEENSFEEKSSHISNDDYSLQNSNTEKYECDSLINNTGGNNSVIGGARNLIMNLNVNNSAGNNFFKNFNSGMNNPNCTGDSSCPYSFYVPLQSLPISERMKIKKEKAKMLLEKKTRRDSVTVSSNNLLGLAYNENLTNAQTNPFSPNSTTPTNNFYSSYTSQYFKNYEANMTGNNGALSMNNSMCLPFTENPTGGSLSKKEMKMLRNRISAQRSRDRKKKEMDDLKIISQNLLNETCLLKRELESRDREIKDMKQKLGQICKNCQDKINAIPSNNSNENINKIKNHNRHYINRDFSNNSNERAYSIVDSSSRRFTSNLKYSMMAGFLVVVCLIGTLSFAVNKNKLESQDNFNGRILHAVNMEKTKTIIKESSIVDKKSTGLIVYNPSVTDSTKLSPPSEYKNNPFKIEKDLNKFIEKTLNDNNLERERHFEASYLGKKRMEFFSKMKNRQTKIARSESENSTGFLQSSPPSSVNNSNEMCVNVDGVAWSIQDELSLDEEENTNQVQDDNRGIILKENPNFQTYNGVVPIRDPIYTYENSNLRDNIKSMYCRDFISTAEENSNLFINLFNKLNENFKQEDPNKE